MTVDRLRIFISSPGDVAEERVTANNVVRRLSDEFEAQLRIEPVFWEHEPLLATATFQKQIPPPRDCEVAICILWSRIGTRLPADITRTRDSHFGPAGSRYESGTEYEFEDAAFGFEEKRIPELLVYRKTADPTVSLKDEAELLRRLEQKRKLDSFLQKWFFNPDQTLKAAFHTFATAAEFEQVLEAHLRKLIERRLPEGNGSAVPAKPSWTAGSPFRGLHVFQFEHNPIFFGRAKAVGGLLAALRANAAAGRAFVLAVGVSGGGKSSLVRAGLLPLLVEPGVVEGVGLWRRALLQPADTADPLLSLATALLEPDALPELGADGTTAAQLADGIRTNPAVTVGLVKGALSQAAASLAREKDLSRHPDARLVLVADQLEELFTLPNLPSADRQAFVAALSALARGGKAWVVATIRGDFYHRCLELPDLVALQEGSGQFALPQPTLAEIGQIICRPAQAAGLRFEEDPATKLPLDEVLRQAAAASPQSLPLLEFALEELYQRKTSAGLLTYAAYEELGGVEGAVARRAEKVFASLAPDVQATLPRLALGLVSMVEGEGLARRQASLQLIAPTPQARAFIDAFVQARLFSAGHTEDGFAGKGNPRPAVVQVVHEALLRNWPRLVRCLEQNRELLAVQARVSAAAARWVAEGKPADRLLGQGKPLAEAEKLAAALGDSLAPDEWALITASRARRRKRRLAVITALIVMAATGIWVRSRVADQQDATTAAGLVKQVMSAETIQLPRVLGEINRYRKWADPLLRQENSRAANGSRQKLHASLALAPVDGGQVDYLYECLLNADPDEVPLIRHALLPYQGALIGKLWSVVQAPQDSSSPARLRAAAALALYDTQGDRWSACASPVVHDLVRENPVFLGAWSESFRPVRRRLVKALGDMFREQQPQRSAERALATDMLADYAADQPDMLADLLMDADEKQFAVIYPKLVEQKERAAPVLIGEIDRTLPPGATDGDRETLAKRQATAAVALMMLGQPAKTLQLLKFSPDLRVSPPFPPDPARKGADPRARSYLVHRFAPLGTDFRTLVQQLQHERDDSIRRALILSLGEFSERQISPSERDALRPKIKGIYQTDADPGTHAAAEWLLQAWGDPEELDQPGRGEVPRRDPWVDDINEQWSRDVEMRKRKLAAVNATLAADKPKPCWYVNGQGQTMVVIPGPAEYAMGSPPGEANRSQDENQHLERIVLTFALDSKPVTIEEYRRFDTEFKGPDLSVLLPKASSPPPDLPVAFVSWYQAAAYCNWLSRQEGLSSDQWCYEQGTTGKVTSVRPNSLGLRGYRLPTEAEMEYSTRAGAFTSRFFGETPELLGKYAWYSDNSIFMLFLAPRPVGSKKPNDLGLFDVCGNVGCWCQDWYRASGGSPTDEAENPSAERTIRDFSFKSHYWTIRSAYRNSRKPTESSVHIGIRVAHSFLP